MGRAYENAREAFNSPRFKFAVRLLISLQKIDNERYRERHPDVGIDVFSGNDLLKHGTDTDHDGFELNKLALYALDQATCDAMLIVMYAGRDGDESLKRGGRYDADRIDAEFAEWWDYLGMDAETHSREIMSEKWPLNRYLADGMHIFRIDER
jgi:hypothetical protein